MRGFIRFMLWTLGILGVIGLLLYLFVFDVWTVPGDDPAFAASIAPNLHPGEHLLVLKSSEVKPGHLVRCVDPDAPSRFVAARVVAKGGDRVDVDEVVLINGKRNPSPHACTEGKVNMRHPITQEDIILDCAVEDTDGNEHDALRYPSHPEATMKTTVEPGKIFLVSDDRHLHLDSRDYGQISPSTCQHIVYRLWGESYFDGSHRFNFLW